MPKTNEKNSVVFDEGSRRRIDDNGYLHVSQTHLTKEQVVPYIGREIPDWENLELEPDRLYYGYRPADELEKAKSTFNGVPLLYIHKQDSAEQPLKELRVGSIGTTPIWDTPYLDNALTVTDQMAIDAIQDGSLKELSCGYFFEPDFTSGEFNGVAYDFVMKNLRGNHVALVKEGRAGPDVYVHDGLPSQLQEHAMPQDNTAPNSAENNSVITQDNPNAAQSTENQKPTEFAIDNDAVREKMTELGLATDDEAAVQTFISGMQFAHELTESDPITTPVGDNGQEDPKTANGNLAGGNSGENRGETKKETPAMDRKPVITMTMDANSIRQQAIEQTKVHFKALNEAGQKVRSLVGELDIMAFDSAEAIYAHALKNKGYDPQKYDKSAYKGMVDVLAAQKPSAFAQNPVMDAAPSSLEGPFAGLKNIKI
ncbi:MULTISPECIES: DUF2213 domain-containing protein [Xenorhabdus]|uniref:DUF2213 domain-containing protein n=1 Tax=Xenorhabdus TaxID=626 RepID=UPI00064A014A|nr:MULTISPECIES: DUF2213 domain-containing protein [Xenorhabdus]KLU14515.1 hypothetical protein AAY47_15750 [Xenorhabdus griffiniae]KOP33306.1 hypothetical protein AFK69_10030 [Xenorhabdus sp. GDc328]